MMQISRYKKLPERKHFLTKLAKSFILAMGLLLVSLLIGMWGYHYYMNLGFADSLINASMILSGMGPVDHADTDGAKIFASFYAIYSGVAFISSMAFLFIPIVHRFLHKMHLEIEGD
ncbi:MAG TPA: hypothetical protein VK835_05630 [Bacteroidia bacterium]|jgi:hypothetical protein|nr:hypothetical protein [Bacteroidia bacterium]